MSMNALRARLNAIARLISGLSKGGSSGLMIRFWLAVSGMAANVTRRHVTRIDRGQAGGEQREQCRLRALQYERRLMVTVGDDPLEVAVPRLAGVDAQFLVRLAGQQIPSAFHVTGGERLLV